MENIYMREALNLAKEALSMGEIPVGAVIVRKSDKKIIGKGYNRRETDKNPLSHAETEAILQASKAIGDWRLDGCAIYVTLEPCLMCAGAIINSRLDEVYFGAYDKRAGAVCSQKESFEGENITYYAGIMEEECSSLLKEFFDKIRR